MSAQKTERLLNLVICLLSTRQFLAKDQIRRSVPQYAECATDEAFDRMFERDKDELRDMGVPLETGGNDAWFDDEVGYRIDRAAYAVPEIQFEPDELAVLGLASRVWQQASLAAPASRALLKLKADGIEPDGVQPRRHRAAGAHQRAGLRAGLRRRPRPPADHLPLPHLRARASRGPATSSRGASCPGTAAGTSSATTATAAPPGCSACRGSPARCGPSARPGEVTVPAGRRLPRRGGRAGPAAADPQRGRLRPRRVRVWRCGAGRPPAARAPARTAGTSSPCPSPTPTCSPRR